MKFIIIVLSLMILSTTSGCALTKLVSVPMRIGGAVMSIVPVAGNTMHDAIDESADIIDEMPF
ncbi:MAG: hypothetical protein HQK72_13205 [Desulfamplus sp.]|nr:hypothetical protein [Desulfamplus sp.]